MTRPTSRRISDRKGERKEGTVVRWLKNEQTGEGEFFLEIKLVTGETVHWFVAEDDYFVPMSGQHVYEMFCVECSCFVGWDDEPVDRCYCKKCKRRLDQEWRKVLDE